jgi:hypothetical protein
VAKSGHCLDQNILSLAVKLCCEDARTCRIAAGSSHRVYQSRSDHIVGAAEDGNCCCRPLNGEDCSVPSRYKDIDFGFD